LSRALANVKTRVGIDEFLKDLKKNLLVSVVSLILTSKEFQAAGPE